VAYSFSKFLFYAFGDDAIGFSRSAWNNQDGTSLATNPGTHNARNSALIEPMSRENRAA